MSAARIGRVVPSCRSASLSLFSCAIFLLLGAPGSASAEAGPVRDVRIAHRLEVELDPAAHRIAVDDRSLLLVGGAVEFELAEGLTIASSEPPAEAVAAPERGRAGASEPSESAPVRRYRVRLPAGGGAFHLRYAGTIDQDLVGQQEESARSFHETLGTVGPAGIYLAGSSRWIPHFPIAAGGEALEFDLTVRPPPGWHLVSQGEGSSAAEGGAAHWRSELPVDEIYLVGGPLVPYRRELPATASRKAVEAWVYLHTPDAELAERYLTATAEDLAMYERLLGAYPYRKFALVENFWETGYGMPSFTLLGPQILRMPFILTSSYPHEILHNWWGNGVFVDEAGGNWCEGLTAYMADHLMQEQRGQGASYRRDRLQDYVNYVRDASAGRDFPLVAFRARHSAATEAVGYGRSSIGFHMLRRKLGDDRFRAWAAAFYREQRGRKASFIDLRRSVQAIADPTEAPAWERFFHDWTERTGAPSLAVEAQVEEAPGGGFVVRGVLRESQAEEPFALDVPIVVQMAESPTFPSTTVATVHLETREASFSIAVPERPVALHVDPSFDLFRRLDPREIPASVSQLFGEPRLLAVVAARQSPEASAAFRALALSWQGPAHQIEVVSDTDLEALPNDRGVWLLGRQNRFAAAAFGAGKAPGLAVKDDRLKLDGSDFAFASHLSVVVVRNAERGEHAVGWIAADDSLLAALPGLGRKLPHYGKYSYLGFEGTEPQNRLKGQWTATSSPLTLDLRAAEERAAPPPPLAPEPRAALATLVPLGETPVVVRLTTTAGVIDLEIDRAHAPQTAANFLRYVDAGHYDGGRFHRTVRPDTETRRDVPIEVVQAGGAPAREREAFPPIAIERTRETGLRHRDGTLSMARAAPDTATSDFFITIGDQPLLDFGGARNPDGQGFAAFGRVLSGMEVVRRIQASPARGQSLEPPIEILSAKRLLDRN